MDDSQSTGSALGELLKDFGVDPNLSNAADQGDQNEHDQFEILQTIQPSDILETAIGEINNPINTILNSDEEFVFQLIDSAPTTTENQLQLKQEEIIQTEEKKTEGEAIMESLTGFGVQSPNTYLNQQQQQQQQQLPQQTKQPYVKILVEPAENKLRFRYQCEGRSAGALHGENSTGENKKFPTIQIVGYNGPAVCVVSLVEHNAPYKAHPHNLVGKDGLCKHGVCSVDITRPDMTYSFQNLGIQCVRKKDAPESLERRQKIKVDPFKQGFAHSKLGTVDLNMVRLCYQVFLKTRNGLVPLQPVVSKIIKDRKAHSDLQIIDYSDDRCPVDGGKKILLFCEKVTRDDIEVHFTQHTKSGETVVAKADFTSNDVHKQYGISLRTPPYVNKSITEPVLCAMFLYKPKSQSSSDPVDFWYIPNDNKLEVKDNLNLFSPVNIKPVMKRSRQPQKTNADEQSSGQIAVPSKLSPAQLHGGGGQVTTVASPITTQSPAVAGQGLEALDNYLKQQQQGRQVQIGQRDGGASGFTKARSPYEQVSLAEGGTAFVMRPAVNSPNVADMNVNRMTQELRDMLRSNADPPRVPQPQLTQPQQPQQQQQQLVEVSSGMSHLNAYLQSAAGASFSQVLEEGTYLPNLSLSGELPSAPDMDNLSRELSSKLDVGRPESKNDNNFTHPQQPSTTTYNDLNLGIQRQISQPLNTPDVSMEGSNKSKSKTINKQN